MGNVPHSSLQRFCCLQQLCWCRKWQSWQASGWSAHVWQKPGNVLTGFVICFALFAFMHVTQQLWCHVHAEPAKGAQQADRGMPETWQGVCDWAIGRQIHVWNEVLEAAFLKVSCVQHQMLCGCGSILLQRGMRCGAATITCCRSDDCQARSDCY